MQLLAARVRVPGETAAGAGLAKELVVGGDLSRLQPMQRLSLVLVQLCRQASGLLSELIRRALIHPSPGGFRFTHGMLRESLAQQADAAKRLSEHHIAAAEYLSQAPQRSALHYLQAGAAEQALRPLLEAANRELGGHSLHAVGAFLTGCLWKDQLKVAWLKVYRHQRQSCGPVHCFNEFAVQNNAKGPL